jgi:integrase/recombinase XerD
VLIQRVVMPVTGTESWTVIGGDGAVVAPVERYLAYLSALERSPNTVRAYAASLRLWFEFLGQAGVGWADAGVEDVARFVAWLRGPGGKRDRAGDGHGAAVAGDGEPSSGRGVRLL